MPRYGSTGKNAVQNKKRKKKPHDQSTKPSAASLASAKKRESYGSYQKFTAAKKKSRVAGKKKMAAARKGRTYKRETQSVKPAAKPAKRKVTPVKRKATPTPVKRTPMPVRKTSAKPSTGATYAARLKKRVRRK